MSNNECSTPNVEGRINLRSIGRWLFLLAAVVLAWPGKWTEWTAVYLPALSPFIGLSSLVAVRAVGVITLLAVPIFLFALFSPRWFCRYACPTGFLQVLLEKIRPARKSWEKWPRIGRWLVLLTIGGAIVGYPVFLWLDPLAIFSGFFHAWRQPFSAMALLAGGALPIVLLLTLIAPGLWCRRLCPLGAFQEFLIRSQPGPVLRGRREFLAAGVGVAGALLVGKAGKRSEPPLRPPGSIDEGRFVGVCVRCGNCAQVCPSRIIQQDYAENGFVSFMTPVVTFEGTDYCREDCNRCGKVCPSGAIARLSIEEKRRRVIGPAVVDMDTCRLVNGEECTVCISVCPYKALSMETAADGISNKPLLDPKKCTGCGACEVACPVTPKAIKVQPGRDSLPSATDRD